MGLICETAFMFSFVEDSAFRVCRGHCYLFWFRGSTARTSVKWLFSMCFPVFVDLFHQLFFICFGGGRNCFFHFFIDICIGFDMRTIQENHFWGKISAFLSFIKNPCENLFYGSFCKAMSEVITDCCEVRNRFIQRIPQKPTIGNVHIDLIYSTPQRWNPIKMLDQYHLK